MSAPQFGDTLHEASAELLAQILDGDPVSIFVLNTEHVVTH